MTMDVTRRELMALAGVVVLGIAGCDTQQDTDEAETEPSDSESQEQEPLDLTGTWVTSDEDSDSWQEAIIEGSTITVYWVSDGGDTRSLYWVGTYVAPDSWVETYSWDSENDHDQTDTALLASGDDTKTFTYKDGQLSWSVSALGTTTTLYASQQ